MISTADYNYHYDVASNEIYSVDSIRYDEAIIVNSIPARADDRISADYQVDPSAPDTATSKARYQGFARFVDFDEY